MTGNNIMNADQTKILLTGFSPFGASAINPSWEAVKGVQAPDEIDLYRLEIPTVFYKSSALLAEVIDDFQPDIVLCVGQAAGQADITPERLAVNINNARSADNEGNTPKNELIVPDGPAAYFSTLPVEQFVTALQSNGLPARLSFSAGTYVCNHVFYALMHIIATRYPHMRGGFVHIPAVPEQIGHGFSEQTPALPLKAIIQGLEIILSVCLSQEVV